MSDKPKIMWDTWPAFAITTLGLAVYPFALLAGALCPGGDWWIGNLWRSKETPE